MTGIRVSVDTEGSFDHVPPAVALSLYRITQEALRNVAKHAHVGAARVTLRNSEETLSLTIADPGVGMDLRAASLSGGLGLLSIKERTRLIHGTVEFSSRPNEGATIVVKVPLREGSHALRV